MPKGIWKEFIYDGGGADFAVDVSETYDIQKNESYVNIQLFAKPSQWGVSWYLDGKFTANGKQLLWSSQHEPQCGINVDWDWKVGTWLRFMNRDITVKHDREGNGSFKFNFGTVTLSTFDFFPPPGKTWAHSWSLRDGTGDTVKLTKIPRKSDIESTKDIFLGEECEISWTPASSDFSYKLNFQLLNWKYETPLIKPGTNGRYTYREIIPLEVAEQMPDYTSEVMLVKLTTYLDNHGGTPAPDDSGSNFEVTIPDYVIPSMQDLKLEIVNNNRQLAQWGIAVAGYTKLKATATGISAYKSPVEVFKITGSYDDIVYIENPNYFMLSESKVITKPGNAFIDVVCTDARNRESEVYTSNEILFYPYFRPKINLFKIIRIESEREHVSVSAHWEISDLGNRNSAVGQLFYKKHSDRDWVRYKAFEPTKEVSHNVNINITDIDFDINTSYDFKMEVMDKLGLVSSSYTELECQFTFLHFKKGGKGFGIGKTAESDSMEVDFPAIFFDSAMFEGGIQCVPVVVPPGGIIEDELERYYIQVRDNSIVPVSISGDPNLDQTIYSGVIYKHDANFGYAKIIGCNGTVAYKFKSNGIWSSWIKKSLF